MTSRFYYIVCSIKESNDLSIMSIDKLQSSLLIHEQRMQDQKEEEHALNIINSKKTGGRYEYRTKGKERVRGGLEEGVEKRVGNHITKPNMNALVEIEMLTMQN